MHESLSPKAKLQLLHANISKQHAHLADAEAAFLEELRQQFPVGSLTNKGTVRHYHLTQLGLVGILLPNTKNRFRHFNYSELERTTKQ